MKSASLPALRVKPELREAVEAALQEGETVSSFMEEAIVSTIQHRRARQAFIERGLAAGERARASGEYHSAESVLAEVDALLDRTP